MDAAVALVQAYLHVNGYFTVSEYPILEGGSNVRTVTDIDILAYRLAGASAFVADGLHGDIAARPTAAAGRVRRGLEPDPDDHLCAEHPCGDSRGDVHGDVHGGHWPARPSYAARSTPAPAAPAPASKVRGGSGPDPALGAPLTGPDMIVGEVKQGRARLNPAMHDSRVLAAALARFGCCDRTDAPALTRRLLATGRVHTPAGHTVRIVAFGDTAAHLNTTQNQRPGSDVRALPAHTRVGVPGADATVSMRHVVDFLQKHLAAQWPQARHTQFHDPALGVLAMLQKWADPPSRPPQVAHPSAVTSETARPARARSGGRAWTPDE